MNTYLRHYIFPFRDRIVGAGLAEVSELKAIEMEVRKSVDNDVKKVRVFHIIDVKFCVKVSLLRIPEWFIPDPIMDPTFHIRCTKFEILKYLLLTYQVLICAV